jgi:hypothetical protein
MSSPAPSESDDLALPEPTAEDVAALRRARAQRVDDFAEWLKVLSTLVLPEPRPRPLPSADAEPFSLD